jgi:hypothetical protein
VSSGSIIADLIPFAATLGIPAAAVTYLQHADAIADFVLKYGEILRSYFRLGGKVDDATENDLKDFMGSVAAIAHDTDGKASIEAAFFENGTKKVKASVVFTTREAREAAENIENQRLQLRSPEHTPHERVLMVFTQSNIKDAPKDKRSGEKVVIEKISITERPLIYASSLAEEQIKHEIREADENVFKKGFVVDVMIETRNGRPVAYKVTNLHQVIDLSES